MLDQADLRERVARHPDRPLHRDPVQQVQLEEDGELGRWPVASLYRSMSSSANVGDGVHGRSPGASPNVTCGVA
jgi:hypothetical protein